ncbi:3-ketoacyl-ACP reductase [Devosia sp.]|uniref:3-ketoacyl-ACP reductase n=1 Tax=Devosia sp. TaxID=1871048 RepID=UPI002EE4093E
MTARTRPVAIVTGGRKGIGLGIARALARAGFDLALTGLPGDDDGADAVLTGLRAEGGEAIYLAADLADLSGHAATVAAVTGRFGGIDCLVNNAGMASVRRGDFLELEPGHFDAIVGTNLRGTVFFTQAVLRAMLADSNARHARAVVNITSVSATMASPERIDYCLTKAGLAAFSQALALRLAESGISVFEVRPGIIRSDMTAPGAPRYDALIAEGLVPMKRWGEPADVGEIVAALAGGRFAFATGSVINADGGLAIARL